MDLHIFSSTVRAYFDRNDHHVSLSCCVAVKMVTFEDGVIFWKQKRSLPKPSRECKGAGAALPSCALPGVQGHVERYGWENFQDGVPMYILTISFHMWRTFLPICREHSLVGSIHDISWKYKHFAGNTLSVEKDNKNFSLIWLGHSCRQHFADLSPSRTHKTSVS